MDPERVRAYLQVACAGLGYDIGEVWWTANENGSSTVAAIEEPRDEGDNALVQHDKKRLRFVQLYTSKSYENRRSELLKPPDCEKDEDDDSDVMNGALRSSISTENLEQHVLSPRLVDAISQTAQVVWANTKKEEGLTGRSDIRLQTAVGMPVAMDSRGNMCIVLMFSPNNVQSTDDAMEYLQSISQSATSSSIPCLLPVFDSNLSNMKQLPPSQHEVVPSSKRQLKLIVKHLRYSTHSDRNWVGCLREDVVDVKGFGGEACSNCTHGHRDRKFLNTALRHNRVLLPRLRSIFSRDPCVLVFVITGDVDFLFEKVK
jgi:hypothetical protein